MYSKDSVEGYAEMVLCEKDERWLRFAGQCLLTGVQLNMSLEDILEYVYETYHGMSFEANEVPMTKDEVKIDMKLYQENK